MLLQEIGTSWFFRFLALTDNVFSFNFENVKCLVGLSANCFFSNSSCSCVSTSALASNIIIRSQETICSISAISLVTTVWSKTLMGKLGTRRITNLVSISAFLVECLFVDLCSLKFGPLQFPIFLLNHNTVALVQHYLLKPEVKWLRNTSLLHKTLASTESLVTLT